jgi:type IV fimbrial biogenesis protein FimT
MSKTSGFTLFELVITMGIAAILAAIAIPSYKYVTNSNRVASEDNALLGDLQFARAEAIKEGQTVTVCVSADGATCAGTDTWNSGWIVFTDLNNDQTPTDAGDTIWRKQAAFVGTDTFTASNSVPFITFNREGFASNIANGTLVTLHTSPINSDATRCLSITLIGMMTILTHGSTDPTTSFTCT